MARMIINPLGQLPETSYGTFDHINRPRTGYTAPEAVRALAQPIEQVQVEIPVPREVNVATTSERMCYLFFLIATVVFIVAIIYCHATRGVSLRPTPSPLEFGSEANAMDSYQGYIAQ